MILAFFIESKKITLKLCDTTGEPSTQVDYNPEISHADGLLNVINLNFSANIKNIQHILVCPFLETSPALLRVVYSIANSLAFACGAQIATIDNTGTDIDYSKIVWAKPPLKMMYKKPAA